MDEDDHLTFTTNKNEQNCGIIHLLISLTKPLNVQYLGPAIQLTLADQEGTLVILVGKVLKPNNNTETERQ